MEFSSKRNFLKIFVLTKRIATIGYEEISVKHYVRCLARTRGSIGANCPIFEHTLKPHGWHWFANLSCKLCTVLITLFGDKEPE